MNAALQCISNIYELTDYFIQGKYVKDINKFTETKTKGALSNSYA
jgi:ubiquitin C-terminal hydrolase